MCKKNVLTIAAVAMLALAIGQIQAATVTIPIDNPGFEDSVLADGEYDYSLDNQGWGYFDNGGEQGSWNPGLPGTSEPGFGGNAPEGQNIGWVNPGGVGVPGGLAQVLTDADATLQADTTYTLTVEVGNPPGYPWNGYKVQLLAGGTPHTPGTGADTGPVTGGTLLAEDNNSLTIAEDTFETSTVTYTYDPELHSGLLGEPLQIRLLSLGNVAAGDYTEVNFDNVRLSYDYFPEIAKNPNPADGATDVCPKVVLSWKPGEFAAPVNGHKVYFSENFNDVNDGIGGITQDANSYALQRLDFAQTYYWRIDEVNAPPDSTVFKGEIWSFTTEPIAYPVDGANIAATASSVFPGSAPEKTIDGSGLNDSDLHSTNLDDMWLSGSTEPQSTWIEYQFDKVYKLHEMWVWNQNQLVESAVGYGFKDVTIEHSADGANWTTLGTTHEFARAPGAADYEYNTTVDFGGAPAKFVRLTANSNWGGILQQYGLSEVRFFSIPVQAREPNPASRATDVDVEATLSWRAGREAAENDVYLSTDEQAVIDGTATATTVTETSYSASLDMGSTYYWRVDEVNDAETTTSWQGDIWSFTTLEFFVVDDFESYNDIMEGEESNLVYETWIDGYNNPSVNGATVGHTVQYEPSMESVIVHGGKQAMPFFYSNTGGATYSEAERTFAAPQDWAKAGIQTLVLYLRADNLSEALDTTFDLTTEGSANWFSQTAISSNDGDAAQSGDISHNEESLMQTTVNGAGTVSFYWKVSSEVDWDFLEFYIDGEMQDQISGEVDWQQMTYAITGSGSHTLEWRYFKDGAASGGEDTGWVDKFEWTGAAQPAVMPGNTGQLYAKVNGAKVDYPGSVADVEWIKWNIDLASLGVDLQAVTTLAVGIDGDGASGTLYFDDFRLEPGE